MQFDDSFKEMFEKEKASLLSAVNTSLWNKVLDSIQTENEFYLIPCDLSHKNVVQEINLQLSELKQKYNLENSVYAKKEKTEFNIKVFDYDNHQTAFLSVVICLEDITIRMLPYNPIITLYPLGEYKLVQKALDNFFKTLFDPKLNQIVEIKNKYNQIENSFKGLTPKTITIAQNSIKTIYEASHQKYYGLRQNQLYAVLMINGTQHKIFYKDFMENPAVLTSLLK